MKHLITYIFILFIFANLTISLLGWYTSNKEQGMSFNQQTTIIDTIWQSFIPQKSQKKNKKNNKSIIDPPASIIKIKQLVNSITEAKPAFQHTYIESYGLLQRLLGRQLMEDASVDNDVVKQPNGQLNFFGKINSIYTSHEESTDTNLIRKNISILKKHINNYSPSSKLYFIARLNKHYGLSPYNLRGGSEEEYTQKEHLFTEIIESMGIPILNLNEYISNNREAIFYNTDHHWRIEYAFKQLPLICKFLNINDSIYTEKHFKLINSQKRFIGSLTKRTGSWFTPLSDTCKYYKPIFETSFTAEYYSTSNTLLLRKGKLEQTLLFEEFLHDKFDANLYNVCNKGDNPLVKIINHNDNIHGNILLLGDSFSAPLITYLALSYQKMDCIDLRSCSTEVLYTMIKKNKYDSILLVYPSYYDNKMYCF